MLQLVMGLLQRRLHPLAVDGDARKLGAGRDELKLARTGSAGLAIVHREGRQGSAGRGDDGLRPGRPHPGALGEVAERGPVGMGQDVLDDHPLAGRGSLAAGADAAADLEAVDGLVVEVGQARSGAVPQVLLLVVEQQDRAEHVGLHRLGGLDEDRQDLLQRGAGRQPLQHAASAALQLLGPLPLGHLGFQRPVELGQLGGLSLEVAIAVHERRLPAARRPQHEEPPDHEDGNDQDRRGPAQERLVPGEPQILVRHALKPLGEALHPLGVHPLQLVVLVAGQQVLGRLQALLAHQLERLLLQVDQLRVGLVGLVGCLPGEGLRRQRLGLLDGGAELRLVSAVAVDPFLIAGYGGHAGRHGEDFVEMNDSPPKLREAQVQPRRDRESGHALRVRLLLSLVILAEEQPLRFFGVVLLEVLERHLLPGHDVHVGPVDEGGALADVGLRLDLAGLLDRRVELGLVFLVALDPGRVAGGDRHERRHGQHLVEVDDGAAQLLDLGLPRHGPASGLEVADGFPHQPCQDRAREQHGRHEEPQRKTTVHGGPGHGCTPPGSWWAGRSLPSWAGEPVRCGAGLMRASPARVTWSEVGPTWSFYLADRG